MASDQPADRVPGSIELVLAAARGKFEHSTDFTVGIEEEYAICDPITLDLVPAYERVDAAAHVAGLDDAVAGELLASEVEFRTGRNESWQQAHDELVNVRVRVGELMQGLGLAVGTSGTHPWADYREQQKIDEPYYDRLVERLGYVAHRNNTFGLHVHVGVRGADRAMAVANALRDAQPLLLALSASSPFLDGRDAGLCSSRSLTFSRTFPRANIMPAFHSFDAYLDHVRWLAAVGSIETYGQMWWGVRPHALHGTVELRMFDGQPDVRDTLALAALAIGTIADLCARHDAGDLAPPQPAYLVDENLWRAAQGGSAAEFIDLPHERVLSGAEAIGGLIARARAAGLAAGLELDAGLDRAQHMLDRGCSALVQRRIAEQHHAANGGDPARDGLHSVYAEVVRTTMTSATAARA